ncbi:unnamed protein product [Linum tenue]|uniref:RING-type domain-containing protein n=1 Tax=Linum tenue TaxID=586396 RepID=A0AAV0L218_9ROSI|nr:unnamed protein product [Linum tenue]
MERNSFRNLQRPKFIADNFNSLNQVISALREAGLESSNLILGVDFTKSNEWSGRYSFHRKSLHAVGSVTNPYEQAISIIGRTLSPFDEDNLIPCFGFGDVSTRDEYVFSFYPDHRPCRGFEEALARYREIIPHLQLSGPTSFAPIIDAAIDIVEKSNGQYHVLVIIADGQVTRNPGIPRGSCSPQEQATLNSIVAARSTTGHPLTKPLPPPKAVIDHDDAIRSIPPLINSATTGATAAPVEPVCPICWTNPKNMAFGCGHTTCQECGGLVTNCPLCRQPITTRIKLFN